MYLWCSKCERAATEVDWHVGVFKHGVCPWCYRSAYRNALKWEEVCRVNGYSEVPELGRVYTMGPVFDI